MDEIKTFKVRVMREVTFFQICTVEIEADTAGNAEKQAIADAYEHGPTPDYYESDQNFGDWKIDGKTGEVSKC